LGETEQVVGDAGQGDPPDVLGGAVAAKSAAPPLGSDLPVPASVVDEVAQ